MEQITMISIYFISCLVLLCEATNYCTDVCGGSRDHTLCRFPEEGPSPECLEYESTVTSETDRRHILDKLNYRRNQIAAGEVRSLIRAANMRALVWNEELAIAAKRWADQCIKHNTPDTLDLCRDLGEVTVGQIIATMLGEAPGLSTTSLVDIWYMELMDINHTVISDYKPSNSPGSRHYDYFTQLIWAESHQVGCSGVKFKEKYFDSGDSKYHLVHRLVCNFAPAGNIEGRQVYNPGEPCTDCEDKQCDIKYPSLCNTAEILPRAGTSSSTAISVTESFSAAFEESKDTIPHLNTETESRTFPITPEINDMPDQSPTRGPVFPEDANMKYADGDIFEVAGSTKDVNNIVIPDCKEIFSMDELVELVKRKLSSDSDFKNMMTFQNTTIHSKRIGTEDLQDENESELGNFLKRVYSNKEDTTKFTKTDSDYFNSTMLEQLVEAVMWREEEDDTDTENETESEETTSLINEERSESIPVNLKDATGNYFYPKESFTKKLKEAEESTETITDFEVVTDTNIRDILFSKPIRKDFIDKILEDEPTFEPSTETVMISPDSLSLATPGYRNMRKWLENINKSNFPILGANNPLHFDNNCIYKTEKLYSKIGYPDDVLLSALTVTDKLDVHTTKENINIHTATKCHLKIEMFNTYVLKIEHAKRLLKKNSNDNKSTVTARNFLKITQKSSVLLSTPTQQVNKNGHKSNKTKARNLKNLEFHIEQQYDTLDYNILKKEWSNTERNIYDPNTAQDVLKYSANDVELTELRLFSPKNNKIKISKREIGRTRKVVKRQMANNEIQVTLKYRDILNRLANDLKQFGLNDKYHCTSQSQSNILSNLLWFLLVQFLIWQKIMNVILIK